MRSGKDAAVLTTSPPANAVTGVPISLPVHLLCANRGRRRRKRRILFGVLPERLRTPSALEVSPSRPHLEVERVHLRRALKFIKIEFRRLARIFGPTRRTRFSKALTSRKILMGHGERKAPSSNGQQNIYSTVARKTRFGRTCRARRRAPAGKIFVRHRKPGKIVTMGSGLHPMAALSPTLFDARIFSHGAGSLVGRQWMRPAGQRRSF